MNVDTHDATGRRYEDAKRITIEHEDAECVLDLCQHVHPRKVDPRD